MAKSFDLDKCALEGLKAQDIQEQLQGFARSTRIHIDASDATLSLNGADLFYHSADPSLTESLATFLPVVPINELGSFHTRLEHFDLCMEDSWTGKFIAKAVRASKLKDNLTILHLDDHTDMMPTLLSDESGRTKPIDDPRWFDPTSPSDWDEAIRTGVIGIGSFMTALYDLPLELDVRHLCHTTDATRDTMSVVAAKRGHPLLPDVEFAAVDMIAGFHASRLGTYTASTRAANLLRECCGRSMIVHVDLDYFINDFNGNIGQRPAGTVGEMQTRAQWLLDELFAALHASGVNVERWIIATSPGFCAARHWTMLISEFRKRIAAAQ